jgi:hypothetical protein
MSKSYGVPDSIGDSESLMETEVILSGVVSDLDKRVLDLYKKIMLSSNRTLPALPKYEDLCKSNTLYYNVCSDYISFFDEIVDLRIRVSSVIKQLKECVINDSRGYNMTLAKNFNNNLKNKIEALESKKFELVDVGKMVSYRIDLLKNIAYSRGEE